MDIATWSITTWITVLVFGGGLFGGIAKLIITVNKVIKRPRPCQHVIDLAERVDKHDTYLGNDRARLEALEKSDARKEVHIENLISGQAGMDKKLDQILMLLIQNNKKE